MRRVNDISLPPTGRLNMAVTAGYMNASAHMDVHGIITSAPGSNNTGGMDEVILQPPYWDPVTTVLLAATMITFMVCALFGNTMVILVIARHRGMRTRTNMFLCSLAIADLLSAALLMPVALTTVIRGTWVFGEIFCQVNGFLMPLFFVASIHTLMYISIHKYVTIVHPFKAHCMTRRRILCLILAAWFWALVTGYVTVHGLNHVLYKPATTQCGPDYPKDLRTYFHPLYMVISNYLTPFIVMTFCYVRIFQEMRAHKERMVATSNMEKEMLFQQQRRITMTLIVVLCIFVMSWTPYILYSVYTSALKDKTSIPTNLNAISYWFGYMNSACNPLIYALRSKAFREGYKELWCRHTPTEPISEATEPLNTYSTLQRLQAFIRNSMRARSVLSEDSYSQDAPSGNRKVSIGSLANALLQGTNRKVSTTSLPESFTTASLPRMYRDPRNRYSIKAPRRPNSSVMAESNGVLHEVNSNISTGMKIEEEEPNERDHLNTAGILITASEPLPNGNESELKEAGNGMYVVTVDADLHECPPSSTSPVILSTGPSNQHSTSTLDEALTVDYKMLYKSTKSVSVIENKRKAPETAVDIKRASSETNIVTDTKQTGLLRTMFKNLQIRSREKLRSMSSTTTPQHQSKNVNKAQSDNTLDHSERKPVHWWQRTPRKTKRARGESRKEGGSFNQLDYEEQQTLTNSEKPRLLRSMSVETLDHQPNNNHKRAKSFTSSNKRRNKSKCNIPTEESQQQLILTSDTVERSPEKEVESIALRLPGNAEHNISPSHLQRSWSDPCMTFHILESKISVHRQLRKDRHKSMCRKAKDQ